MMKILIAEDDPASSVILKRLLFTWGFDIVTAFDGRDAWRLLQEDDSPQIAILDWMMPGIDGLELCRRLRDKEKAGDRYTYVIMLTAKGDRDDIVAGIDAGADEYIIKPFDKRELRARLRTGQRIIELQVALRAANRKLRLMSRFDPLTGALSRSAILDDLDLAVYRSRREKKPLSIALIDIDNLRELNEHSGRAAGDRVLQDSVRRISACLRRTDSFGRYGTDEFLVVLPGVDLDTGMTVCLRIRDAIGEKEIVVNDHSLPVTVSQCLALWDGKADCDEFTASAERTLSATTVRGRSRVEKALAGSTAR